MSILHGIKFIDVNSNIEKHSYRDFGLILENQDIKTPEPYTYTVDIPFKNGSLDLTETLGEVTYKDRSIKFVFNCIEGLQAWETRKTQIANFIHGAKMKIITWSDPNYYYIGRCNVDDYNSSKTKCTVSISCNCEPFKYHHDITTVNIVSGDNTVENTRMLTFADLTCPKITIVNGTTYTTGTHLKAIKLSSGSNVITSDGEATLTFRKGEL